MAHVFRAFGRRTGPLAGLGLALATLVAGRPAAPLAQGPAAVPAAPARPSLLVVIVVDQFRADYVDRYGHQWRHGLRRILEDGAYFTEAAYRYASTMTCAGHATIGTGTLPQTHGLIANAWYDRTAGRDVICTEDRTVTNVGYGTVAPKVGDSGTRLAAPSLADEMRAQQGVPPRIVTIALKARAAMPLAGHRSTLTTWFDGPRGFVTSPAMGRADRDPFLAKYLAAHPVDADADETWDRRLPAAAYQFEDDGVGELGMGATFPHVLSRPSSDGQVDPAFYGNWQMSPFADAYLGRLAQAALTDFALGKGPGTDFLAVSFSALDVIGHAYGPRSHEVQDTLVRLDETIGTLLAALDREVGRDRYTLALTSDHGAGPVPAQMRTLGLGGGVIDRKAVASAITTAVGGSVIDSISGSEIYLSRDAAARLGGLDAREWDGLRAALEEIDGVARVFRTTDLLAGRYQAADRLAHAARLSAYPGRTGDLVLITDPYWFPYQIASTHGTPYGYDQRVPLAFFGRGVRPGRYAAASSPADVAPTLARTIGVTLAAAEGIVRLDALETPGGVPAPAPTPAAQVP
jgi:hypothetical protein